MKASGSPCPKMKYQFDSKNARFYKLTYGLFAKRSGQQKKFHQYGAKQQQFL